MEDGQIWVQMEGINNAISMKDPRMRWDIWDKLSLSQRIKVIAKIADIMEAAHKAGMVHNDLKSKNIIINPQGDVMVIDWELSTAIGEEQEAGTPGFAAPEIKMQPQSDVYSLERVMDDILSLYFIKLEPVKKGLIALRKRMSIEESPDLRPTMQEVAKELRRLAVVAELREIEANLQVKYKTKKILNYNFDHDLLLGAGTEGTVYRARKDPQRFYKIFSEEYLKEGMNELKILTYLNSITNFPLQAVPRVLGWGKMSDGGLWISMKGVANAKSIVDDSGRFSRVWFQPKVFTKT